MAPGTHFQPVLGDSTVNKASVGRVVFCSGKHYYALTKQREATNNMNTAIVRLEVSIYASPYGLAIPQLKSILRHLLQFGICVCTFERHFC